MADMEDIIPSGITVLMFVLAILGLVFYRKNSEVTAYCVGAIYAIIFISGAYALARAIWS